MAEDKAVITIGITLKALEDPDVCHHTTELIRALGAFNVIQATGGTVVNKESAKRITKAAKGFRDLAK